jgi:DNA-binding beta-propeller fold protein YncE
MNKTLLLLFYSEISLFGVYLPRANVINRAATEPIAVAMPWFSLDIVGVIGQYAREWRFVASIDLGWMDWLGKVKNWNRREHLNFLAVRNQNVYIAHNNALRIFELNGSSVRTLRGFNHPRGIAFDTHGNTLVADTTSNGYANIKVVKQNGSVGTFSRSPPCDMYVNDNCSGICVRADTGAVFVCCGDHVKVFDKNGRTVRTLGQADRLWDVAVSTNRTFVTNRAVHCVQVFDEDGRETIRIGYHGCDVAQFQDPMGVAYDSKSGNVLVCDTGNHRLQVFSVDGDFLQSLDMVLPLGVCVDDDGMAYVCSTNSEHKDFVYILCY